MQRHSTSNFGGYKIRILAGCWADSDLIAHWNVLTTLMGKNIGFWQAVVQTRIWLPIKMLQPCTTFLSVSNSTAYWLYCINNYIQPQLCSVSRHSSAIGYRSVSIYEDRAVWIYCVGVILQLIERTKSLQMRYLAAAKLELTDTVAIQPIPTWYPMSTMHFKQRLFV